MIHWIIFSYAWQLKKSAAFRTADFIITLSVFYFIFHFPVELT